MNHEATENFPRCTRTKTRAATFTLTVGGCLVMSCLIAQPASAEDELLKIKLNKDGSINEAASTDSKSHREGRAVPDKVGAAKKVVTAKLDQKKIVAAAAPSSPTKSQPKRIAPVAPAKTLAIPKKAVAATVPANAAAAQRANGAAEAPAAAASEQRGRIAEVPRANAAPAAAAQQANVAADTPAPAPPKQAATPDQDGRITEARLTTSAPDQTVAVDTPPASAAPDQQASGQGEGDGKDRMTYAPTYQQDGSADAGPTEGASTHAKTTPTKTTPTKTAHAGSTSAAPDGAGASTHAKSDHSAVALFRPDPQYEDIYNADGQVDIYGGKSEVIAPRPLLELGRQQYTSGDYDDSPTILGIKNPLLPGLSIYGDWRTAVAYNRNNGNELGQIATRLNLDIDFKITGTERVHAFFTPFQDGGKFSRYEFGNFGNFNSFPDGFSDEYDFQAQTLFFEGDVGSIISGFTNEYASFDLPFTVGLFPLFLQNGIWANDAILGGAFSIPAQNSPALGLSNYDITFFAAFDNVDNPGVREADGSIDNHNTNLYGVTAFVDAFDGYIEGGYGLLQGYDDQDGLLAHFFTASYSRRFANTLSNSTRVFWNTGEDNGQNVDGFAVISENSLISGLPSTLLPYANFFVGFDTPQPLVSNTGLLKNVGINFETDDLTGFPRLDDTASNTWGGAIGVQYLFNLDQQIVIEFATVQPFGDRIIGPEDPQYAIGLRYQLPITRAWLLRADATYQFLEGEAEDNSGIRLEARRKF